MPPSAESDPWLSGDVTSPAPLRNEKLLADWLVPM
jgi:hypothetical protein